VLTDLKAAVIGQKVPHLDWQPHMHLHAAMQDTDEILATPVLGPLARQAVRAIDPSLDPTETVLPLATLPGTSWLPTPLPVPDVRQRVYFRCGSQPKLADMYEVDRLL
jgi:hypothetical protein